MTLLAKIEENLLLFQNRTFDQLPKKKILLIPQNIKIQNQYTKFFSKDYKRSVNLTFDLQHTRVTTMVSTYEAFFSARSFRLADKKE